MKKFLWRSASVFGIMVVILSATASHTGEDLIYTIPFAILGCFLCLVGVAKVRRITEAKRATIHNPYTAYRLGFRRNMKHGGK